MPTIILSAKGADRREVSRQLAAALSNELEHADHGTILSADGLTAGRWSLSEADPRPPCSRCGLCNPRSDGSCRMAD